LAALFLRAFFFLDFLAMPTSWRNVADQPEHPNDTRPAIRGWILIARDVNVGRAGRMADEIRAEMVANVWKVVASAGDEVAEGDTLVILESMKMEIPVLAESDGVLQQLAVNEGDVVQEGDLIAVIE
jgi:acetyl-CoA carboxylase biotin carboxyl carrier protein